MVDLAEEIKLETSIYSTLVYTPFPLRHGDHLRADMIRSSRAQGLGGYEADDASQFVPSSISHRDCFSQILFD